MMVKICGITNEDDALASAKAGATALGFNFWPGSPRYLEPHTAARIIEELPAGVWKVGVFVNERPSRVEELARNLGLDVVQLHGDESPEALPEAARIWKAVRVSEDFSPDRLDPYCVEAFLLEGSAPALYGGSGRTFAWARARDLGRKIILAGGLDAMNVRAAIQAARPWGVDACSRLEATPGRKDHARVRAFIQAALA